MTKEQRCAICTKTWDEHKTVISHDFKHGPRPSKYVSTEAQRKEAYANFLTALDAHDVPVSIATAFQAGWDACMRRSIHSPVETQPAASKPLAQRLRERAAIREMEGGFPDAELFNEAAIALMPQDETSEPPEPTTDMIKQGIWAWERTGSRSVADDVRAIYVAMRRMEMRAVEPTPCPECVAVRKLGLLACQKHLPEKASCRHVFDFVPFKGVVCTRCGVAATTETIPPNHSAHHWIKQGAGAICDGCGLIGGDPSSSSEKASAFKCVCGELHTLGDGHVCKSQKASDDLNCLICGKLWRSQHTDQERADCSAAL